MYVSAVKDGGTISSGFIMPAKEFTENSGSVRYLSATTSGRKELGGFVTNKYIEIPDGRIVKIVNNMKRNGRDYLNAALLVLVHKKAGLLDINGVLPTASNSALGTTIPLFFGNGLVLSDEDVVNLGYDINRMFVNKFRNKEEIDEGFDIIETTEGLGIEGFTSVSSQSGSVSISAKPEPRKRKIILT